MVEKVMKHLLAVSIKSPSSIEHRYDLKSNPTQLFAELYSTLVLTS